MHIPPFENNNKPIVNVNDKRGLEMPLYRYRKHSDNITNNLENVNKYNKKLKEKHKNL